MKNGRGTHRPLLVRQNPEIPSIHLAGVRVHSLDHRQAVDHLFRELDHERGGWVVTANLDFLRRLSIDDEFLRAYNEASLALADGMPLVWAAGLQGTPLPERVAGSDLISSISAAAAGACRSVFLLGGAPGTAEGAAYLLCRRNPALRVAGTYCPAEGFEADPATLREIRRQLEETQPDIVFVALGSPKQEYLIRQLRGVLPRAWWLGIGISFSFLTGAVRRAPLWMQRSGLEWLHRLLQEPRRLARRYLVDGLPFAARLLGGAALQRLGLKAAGVRRPAPIPADPSAPRRRDDGRRQAA